jgi:hypothetical protein
MSLPEKARAIGTMVGREFENCAQGIAPGTPLSVGFLPRKREAAGGQRAQPAAPHLLDRGRQIVEHHLHLPAEQRARGPAADRNQVDDDYRRQAGAGRVGVRDSPPRAGTQSGCNGPLSNSRRA